MRLLYTDQVRYETGAAETFVNFSSYVLRAGFFAQNNAQVMVRHVLSRRGTAGAGTAAQIRFEQPGAAAQTPDSRSSVNTLEDSNFWLWRAGPNQQRGFSVMMAHQNVNMMGGVIREWTFTETSPITIIGRAQGIPVTNEVWQLLFEVWDLSPDTGGGGGGDEMTDEQAIYLAASNLHPDAPGLEGWRELAIRDARDLWDKVQQTKSVPTDQLLTFMQKNKKKEK
jgi:hypothetical protein